MIQVFRENRPGLMVLMMVLMASVGSLVVGTIMTSTDGMNDTALMLILFGAIVLIFIVVGVVISICSESFRSESTNLPYSDRPPKYRETWRRQHLESCSPDTIPAATLEDVRTRCSTNISRLDVRSLFSLIPGVHEATRRPTSASMINQPIENDLQGIGRTVRANTAPACDEELPTYAEAMER